MKARIQITVRVLTENKVRVDRYTRGEFNPNEDIKDFMFRVNESVEEIELYEQERNYVLIAVPTSDTVDFLSKDGISMTKDFKQSMRFTLRGAEAVVNSFNSMALRENIRPLRAVTHIKNFIK